MVGHFIDARAATDRSFYRFTAEVHLNVHHVMFLNVLRTVVSGTIEDKITWLHLLFRQLNRQSIKLVGLVAGAKMKAKFVA